MNPQECKVFVGGVPHEASEETLAQHFEKYGEIKKCEIPKHKETNCNRGFGFVTFSAPSSLDQVYKDEHVILGKSVEVKKAKSKSEMAEEQRKNRVEGSAEVNVNKIFVGGLPPSLTEEELKGYFESFGRVRDAAKICGQEGRPRGFGFVTFESEVPETALGFKTLKGKRVEVKRAYKPNLERNNNINNRDQNDDDDDELDHAANFYDAYNNGLDDYNNNNDAGWGTGFPPYYYGSYNNYNAAASENMPGRGYCYYASPNFHGAAYQNFFSSHHHHHQYYQDQYSLPYGYGNPHIIPQLFMARTPSVSSLLGTNGGNYRHDHNVSVTACAASTSNQMINTTPITDEKNGVNGESTSSETIEAAGEFCGVSSINDYKNDDGLEDHQTTDELPRR